jgi:hypothetical protein
MREATIHVRTTLRIPGNWSHPRELVERMPDGYSLAAETLTLPDGVEIQMSLWPPDDQFAQIFKSSCRQRAAVDELAIVDGYTVNIGLSGTAGSLKGALNMMHAGTAIVRAGGAGVFIDNSALAHGGGHWIEMTEDGGPDALSFAFAAIVRGQQEVWTMGMHVLGLPDILMRRCDADADEERIVEVIRYLASGEKPMGDSHVLADETGPQFRVVATSDEKVDAASPMHNPFGRLKLLSLKEIGENN